MIARLPRETAKLFARSRILIPATICIVLALLMPAASAIADDFQDDDAEQFTDTSNDAFHAALAALGSADSFNERADAARALARIEHNAVLRVLGALLEGQLYTTRADGRVVIATSTADGFSLRDPTTDESAGEAGRREVSRIGVNNALRSTLREVIAALELGQDDPRRRIEAIRGVARAGDVELVPVLQSMLETEDNARVARELQVALASMRLMDEDNTVRLAAIEAVRGQMRSHVRTRLTRIANDEGIDTQTRAAADAALEEILRKQANYEVVQTIFFGLSLGSILALAAIGLAITFGIMGVINMAHGELIMLGAYTTFVIQQLFPGQLTMALLLAIPAAFLVSGLVGVAIERGIVQFLYGRPLETLLATFGVSLILQQAVRSIFSPLNRPVVSPSWLSGSWEIVPGLDITYNRLYILLFSLIVFALLFVVLRRTRLGLEMRAVTQNRAMARAMGIRSARVDALTFGLGSGIAGVAGVALAQITNVGPNLGQAYIVDSFMVVVFGGVGNLWGTLVSGLTLGVANKLIEPFAGAVVAKILVLIFIILFIQKRPRGMFPQKGRAAEN